MKRSGVRLALVAGAVLLLLLAGGAFGWREWTHSPSYSLKQLAAAVEHRDRYELEKYVDLDALLHAAVTDSADGTALAAALGSAVVTNLKPQLIKMVEDGTSPSDSRFAKGVQKLRDPSFAANIERQGRNAYFSVPTTTDGGALFTLKIHLTQVPDGYWRIDRVANLKELRAAEAEEEQARKAAIEKANDAKLAKVEVVARLHTSVRGRYGWERKNRFQFRLENKSDKAITAMSGRIRLPAQEFKEGIKGNVRLDPGEAGTYVWEFDVNQFIDETERVFALGETERFEVDVESLTYADGSRVRRGSEEN